jgi:hypothetical protein
MRGPIALALAALVAGPGCAAVEANRQPWCRPEAPTVLLAQAVPSADLVPCVRDLPAGWTFDGFTAEDGTSSFALASVAEEGGRVEVRLTPSCPAPRGEVVPGDRGATLERDVTARRPYRATWTSRFDGGCVVATIVLGDATRTARQLEELERALGLLPRDLLEAETA